MSFNPRDRTAAQQLRDDTWLDHGQRADRIRSGERAPISLVVRRLVYARDRWTCQRCSSTPHAGDRRRLSGALHLDHIVPWSAGGSDRSDNLRTLCGPCNMDRSNFMRKSDVPALGIARICVPCLCNGAALRPEHAIDVWCGSRHHDSWALPGWHIL